MIRRPPRSTQSRSSAASDVYKRQGRRAPRLRPREPGPCGPPRRRAARRRRSSAPRPRPSTRAARRKARRWLWRPPRSALRPPPGQRAGTLDPRVQQLVLHGELADAAHGGVELALEGIALALLEPRVHAGERLVFPALEAVDLNAELAGERLERFSAQQPQRDLTLAREAPALPRSKWAQGHEVTLGLWVLLCHDGPFSRTLMLHKLVSRRSGAAAVGARGLARAPGLEELAQKRADVSLDRDHPARLLKLRLGARKAPLQLCILHREGTFRLTPPGPREGLQDALLALPAPGGEVGRVEAFAAQQGADLTGPREAVRLVQDAQLVLGAEAPPLGPLHELGIRRRRGGGASGGPCATLAYGSLRSAAAGSVPPYILPLQQ